MTTIPDTNDPSVRWEPADEAALAEAGINPDDWRTQTGEILGYDLDAGPPASSASLASIAEMADLESDPTDDESLEAEAWEHPSG